MPRADEVERMTLALKWIQARLNEGSTPDPVWAYVVAFGLTGEPSDAADAYEARRHATR